MNAELELLERLRAALGRRTGFSERRMMGGTCFMVAGHMCCGTSRGQLMARVGRDRYEGALSEPGVTPLEFGSRRPVGYVRVATDALERDADFDLWLELSLATVRQLPPR